MSEQYGSGHSTDQAKHTAQRAKNKAGQMTDQAQDVAEQYADKAQNAARPYIDKAEQVAKDQASQRKNQAAGTISGVADALRQAGDQMRDQNQGMFAGYADQAADEIDSFAGYLKGQTINDLIDEAERFGRNQPMLLVGGAFALGMLAARFLKASRPQSSSYQSPGYRTQPASTGYHSPYDEPNYPEYGAQIRPRPDSDDVTRIDNAVTPTTADYAPNTNPDVSGDTPVVPEQDSDYSATRSESRRDNDATG